MVGSYLGFPLDRLSHQHKGREPYREHSASDLRKHAGRKQTSSSALGSFFIGLSLPTTILAVTVLRSSLVGFLTGGFDSLTGYYNWPLALPILLSPFILLASLGFVLLSFKRNRSVHFARVPFAIGLALSIAGVIVLGFMALMVSMLASDVQAL